MSELFHERLKRLMQENGFDIPYRFADVVGISKTSMYAYLHGQSFPTIDNLFAMADALGVTADELMLGKTGISTYDSCIRYLTANRNVFSAKQKATIINALTASQPNLPNLPPEAE